jgi:hypothetical protein
MTISANSQVPEAVYVVLHMSQGPSKDEVLTGARLIVEAGQAPFRITDDIWMERFDKELGKKIETACSPAQYNISDADYDRHLYAFVRRVPSGEKSKYEGMSKLAGLIALSRLVNPTSTGDRYCARIFRYGDPNSPIEAVRFFGVSPDVALIDGRRDWLSASDGKTLLRLVPWLTGKMHSRVHHAYWNHETALRSYYLDVKWTFVVSAFEALMNTRKDFVSLQFRERVKQLADHFKIPITIDELKKAYELRSGLVHSQKFLFALETVLQKENHVPLYRKLEALLRKALLECLLDANFGDYFRDESSVATRWPVKFPPTRKKHK